MGLNRCPKPLKRELVVLGAGPGGYAAAFLAADKGMKVTLIDAGEKPGGTCLHVGCIPSKALLHAAKLITDAREAAHFGLHFGPPKIDLGGVRGQWQKVVDTLAGNLRRAVQGAQGRVTSTAAAASPTADTLAARRRPPLSLRATASSPPAPSRRSRRRSTCDSRASWTRPAPCSWRTCRRTLLVVGGGYIGLEMGYVYAALGSKVTVVELTDGLLPGVDRDLVQPLHKRAREAVRQDLPQHQGGASSKRRRRASRRRSKARK